MNRILVIDDEESICFAMSEYFSMQGYHVDCAQAVEEAKSLLESGDYSLAIVDLRLSRVHSRGGLEIVRFLRERCPQTRIIVLTAYGSPEAEREVRRYGVDAFLHKPKPLPDVAQVVYGLVGAA